MEPEPRTQDGMPAFGERLSALSEEDDGTYTMYHPVVPDFSISHTLFARVPGYELFTMSVFTMESGFVTPAASDGDGKRSDPETWDGVIRMVPKGDMNGDGAVNLTDAIIVFRIIVGMGEIGLIRTDYTESEADVNGDDRIGGEELIRILRYVAGMG